MGIYKNGFEWTENSTEINFENNLYYKINKKWWLVQLKNEKFFTGSNYIEIQSPEIIKETNIKDIYIKYLRIKKLKRILND